MPYPHELIGKEIEVVASPNRSLRGIRGKIINETKMTIQIEQRGIYKTLLKRSITFTIKGSGHLIKGATLIRQPEDRLRGT